MIKTAAFLILLSTFSDTAIASQALELFKATKIGDSVKVKKLIDGGADVNSSDERGQNPLHHACYLGHLEIAKILIANGARINQGVSDLNLTPLHGATMNGDPKLVEFLVEQGAEINSKDSSGGTPLFAACWIGATETVKYLIKKGAKFNIRTEYGATLLHCAAQSGKLDLVQFFLKKGIKVNIPAVNGATPLHLATAIGSYQVVKLLISSGADKELRMTQDSRQSFCIKSPILADNDIKFVNLLKNQTALDIAMATGNKQIIALLE